jgi:hypothetical protein
LQRFVILRKLLYPWIGIIPGIIGTFISIIY